MQGMALVRASSPLPGLGFSYVGDLALVQREPIAHKGRDNR